jgi:CheY-like chemotaxis protein
MQAMPNLEFSWLHQVNKLTFNVILLDLNLSDIYELEVCAIIKKPAQVIPYIDVNRKR